MNIKRVVVDLQTEENEKKCILASEAEETSKRPYVLLFYSLKSLEKKSISQSNHVK